MNRSILTGPAEDEIVTDTSRRAAHPALAERTERSEGHEARPILPALAERSEGHEARPIFPLFPPGRYGRRRSSGPPGRLPGGRLPLLLGVAGALVGLVLAAVLYTRHGNPTYRPTVVSFELSDDHATVRFRVHKPAHLSAICHVRARGRTGAEVGAADVAAPPGPDVAVEHTLATSASPVTVEVTRCGAPGAQDR
jgi:uncharacterized protein DUF4307